MRGIRPAVESALSCAVLSVIPGLSCKPLPRVLCQRSVVISDPQQYRVYRIVRPFARDSRQFGQGKDSFSFTLLWGVGMVRESPKAPPPPLRCPRVGPRRWAGPQPGRTTRLRLPTQEAPRGRYGPGVRASRKLRGAQEERGRADGAWRSWRGRARRKREEKRKRGEEEWEARELARPVRIATMEGKGRGQGGWFGEWALRSPRRTPRPLPD